LIACTGILAFRCSGPRFPNGLYTWDSSGKVAQALIAPAPHSLQPEIVEIGQLRLYNQDVDDSGNPRPAWTAFRQQVKAYDAVLFVTPEYNRAVPAPLKNAIDVGSRPHGKSVWTGHYFFDFCSILNRPNFALSITI